MTPWRLLAVALGMAALPPAQADTPPGGLAVVCIRTPGGEPVGSRQWRQGATVSVVRPDGTTDHMGAAAVRAFGNSSFAKPKKPLALRFDTAQACSGLRPTRGGS